ncbi:uncharacterized protein EDB91DRAFT_1171047 [Suillus paluster]|uniref:uncharacterized protein n=1 Tax=Suillus paluster TaxID=48578 RepID=UPI001B866606|nr:uncharacterized protein EDB91DRAFT_1171047 [Suillus paluster]KAG1724311.1 hypothetical protein EDB91DRAFT_1171047 [Suillus paluster]
MCVFLALSSCGLLCRSSARLTLSDNHFLHRYRHLSITSGSPAIKRACISVVLQPPLSPSPARIISETRRRLSDSIALSSIARVSQIISASSSRISSDISRLTTIYQYRYLNDSIIKQECTSTTWILEHLFLA